MLWVRSRDESVFAENLMIWHPRFWRHQTTTALGNGFYNSANPFEDLEKSGPVGNVFRQNFGELVISERHFDSVKPEYSNIRCRIVDLSNHTSP